MKKIHVLLVAMLICALPNITLSQANVANFDSVAVGRYDTVPAMLASKGVAVLHGDVENINPCSNGYHHALKMSTTADSIEVGQLTQSTSLTLKVSGNDSPGMTLIIEASASKYSGFTPVAFSYSSGGPCYTVLTDMIDQGYFIRFRAQSGKIVKIFWIQSDNGLLPVELVAFSATRRGSDVTLKWQTATEVNNYGFDVERSDEGEIFNKIGFVEGHGTVNTPQNYSYTDLNATGTIYYRLTQIDRDGTSDNSAVVMVMATRPQTLRISDTYPNPFNPTATIAIVVPETQNITLNVFDAMGRLIETLHNGLLEAGSHNFSFNASALASGTYFVRLDGATASTGHKIVLAK